jgi:hypothetical protein
MWEIVKPALSSSLPSRASQELTGVYGTTSRQEFKGYKIKMQQL